MKPPEAAPAQKKRPSRTWYGVIAVLLLILTWLLLRSCPGPREEARPDAATAPAGDGDGRVLVTNDLNLDFSNHKVTFIEIGADRCIPCQEMQPIMREIAAEHPKTVRVVFYDVWKDPAATRYYGVQLIPTQVFIDSSGREIFRHVGLFPKEQILAMLRQKGMLP
jgi:thioredoxin 1